METMHRAWRGGRGEWRTHLVTALGSSVAFLCLALALLTVVNLRSLQQRWESVGRISAFLAQQASEDDVRKIVAALDNTGGVGAVEFVSSRAARAQLLEGASTSVLRALPIEAFPPSLEITLTPTHTPAQLDAIATRLKKLAAIESIETYGTWSERVSRFVGAAISVAVALALVVFLAVVTTVSSATKLMLERRHVEVEVLRVVGATSAYVKRPFMVEGAVQGAVGASGAVLLSALCFAVMRSGFDEQLTLFLGTSPQFLPWSISIALVACGAVLGALAAGVSLRKWSLA